MTIFTPLDSLVSEKNRKVENVREFLKMCEERSHTPKLAFSTYVNTSANAQNRMKGLLQKKLRIRNEKLRRVRMKLAF